MYFLSRPASSRPAGLGWWPRGTALLLDAPDALLVSVEVVFVQSRAVGGRPAWSRLVGLTLAHLVPPLHRLDDQRLHVVHGGGSLVFAQVLHAGGPFNPR
jgi:hypothetical protein